MATIGAAAGKLAKGTVERGLADIRQPGLATGAGWKPAEIGRDFRLDEALETAAQTVSGAMNVSLAPEGLVVKRQQGVAEMPVLVTEQRTSRVLKAYDLGAFLGLYAGREKMNGVVVDGQV